MSLLVLLFLAFSLCGYLYVRRRRKPPHPLPPGPRRLPIIGNLLQLPRALPWVAWAQWSKQYGSDILYIDAAGTSIIVINSYKIATELLDKRSAIYSSRPPWVMLNDIMQSNWLFAAMEYGGRWKERRRLFQQYFHPANVANYQPQELQGIRQLLPKLLHTPAGFMDHLRHLLGAITISMAYGIDALPSNDPYIKLAERATAALSAASIPGKFLVEPFPILKHVPEWFPGAGFKRKGNKWAKYVNETLYVPFDMAERNMASGIATSSFTSQALSEIDETTDIEHQRRIIRETAATCYIGASDTTVSALNFLIFAMLCYPEVQDKAQAELDSVLNQGRLPDFADAPSLPYIAALVKEVLRWNPAIPLGVPHALTEDDIYMGYCIPRNSVVVSNIWAMLHDEIEYPDPLAFRPERFLRDGKLDPEVRDPATIAFGFGRRICPASHIGATTLWITAASILSTFSVTKAVDENGCVIEPSMEYMASATICHPAPFKCTIKPRSKEAEMLILSLA